MKLLANRYQVLIVLITLLIIGACDESEDKTCVWQGNVTHFSNNQPASGVNVKLSLRGYRYTNVAVLESVTDMDGKYSFQFNLSDMDEVMDCYISTSKQYISLREKTQSCDNEYYLGLYCKKPESRNAVDFFVDSAAFLKVVDTTRGGERMIYSYCEAVYGSPSQYSSMTRIHQIPTGGDTTQLSVTYGPWHRQSDKKIDLILRAGDTTEFRIGH